MKKIGTLSYHRAINYGALLQVYALQEVIKKLGAECEVIDYRSGIWDKRYKEVTLKNSENTKDYLKCLLKFLGIINDEKLNKFKKFSNNYLNLSEPLFSGDDLKKKSIEYDEIIVGSDQVWNHHINDFDENYYLNFLDDKKNSYAASFGFREIEPKLRNKYYNLLNNYENISVRENEAAEIMNSLFSYKPKVVLDPTMLIEKEKWYDIGNEGYSKKPYILIYGFSGKKYTMDLAKNIAKKNNFDIRIIQKKILPHYLYKYEGKAGPKDFIALFKNAKYILTNSFHGTVFSINFNKQFFTELLTKYTERNTRLEHILKLFNLEDRIIKTKDPNIIKNKINYKEVNKKLQKERNKSLEVLQRIVSD